jgi:hypothetical protein
LTAEKLPRNPTQDALRKKLFAKTISLPDDLRKSPLAELLSNITSMIVDVLPPFGERYIVVEGRSNATRAGQPGTIMQLAPD